jgi:hypothetical protein
MISNMKVPLAALLCTKAPISTLRWVPPEEQQQYAGSATQAQAAFDAAQAEVAQLISI